MNTKTLKINKQTHERLEIYGHKNETFDQIINRLLDELAEC